MTRWFFWSPFIVLTVGVGIYFLRLGWIAATITESDVINAYAEMYLADQRARDPGTIAALTDCSAMPGTEPRVWIVIACGNNPCDPNDYVEYHVNALGSLVRVAKTACPEAVLTSTAV